MRSKGIITVEYGILIAVLVTALLAMFLYLRLAICGRWRSAIDRYSGGRQYYPGRTEIRNEEYVPPP